MTENSNLFSFFYRYSSSIFAMFVAKSLAVGAAMMFFGYELHPLLIKKSFPSLEHSTLQPILGVLFALVGLLGFYAVKANNYYAKLAFCMIGIIFSSIMGSAILIMDLFNITGVTYSIDAFFLSWVFIQLRYKANLKAYAKQVVQELS